MESAEGFCILHAAATATRKGEASGLHFVGHLRWKQQVCLGCGKGRGWDTEESARSKHQEGKLGGIWERPAGGDDCTNSVQKYNVSLLFCKFGMYCSCPSRCIPNEVTFVLLLLAFLCLALHMEVMMELA